MKITRFIVSSLIVAFGVAGSVSAQVLRDVGPPSEFPPASYTAKQFVDSRGCIYMRGSVDGKIAWFPRVTAQRKMVCVPEPTSNAAAPAKTRGITLHAAQVPSAGPVPTVIATPKPAAASVKTVAKRAAAPDTVARAAIAAEPAIPSATRVVPRHVHDNRQNTRNVSVPNGYRPVWTDDRLNPYRAERTLAPSVATANPGVPHGFRAAWKDDRLNTNRGRVTARGEAQTDQIWNRELPRTLTKQPTQGRIVQEENNARQGNSPYWVPPVQATPASQRLTRLSTRSKPLAKPEHSGLAVR